MTDYRRCIRCVMDTSDPLITFDVEGKCSHCTRFFEVQFKQWHPNEHGAKLWQEKLELIRKDGRNCPYDCIVGISGGIDSSFLAIRLKEAGLRMLAVHVDGGWNSEVAVGNIERLVKQLGIDLYTHVVDWEAMREIQLAFLRAAVPNQDIPQDHAFFAELFRHARRHRIRWFLSGHNLATESILPKAWGFNPMDARHIAAIHRRFGTGSRRGYPLIGFWQHYLINPRILRLSIVRPLDLMSYDKRKAKEELTRAVGWRDYGEKHHESRFTRFFQGWYLPERYGWDKRKAHYSSMIVSGMMTREEALSLLEQPTYDFRLVEEDRLFIAKKLGITAIEFADICRLPPRRHEEFPNNQARLETLRSIYRKLENLRIAITGSAGTT